MTIYKFNCLDEVLQIELLWSSGVLIGSRQESVFKILLYQIDSFYVEVFYQYFQGRMVKLISFADTNLLEPYLDSINIGSLLTP